MPVKLVSSGGGSVTLNAPSTGSDFSANVPARDGALVGADSSGNLRINSGYGSEAVAYGCRAWVNVRGDCGINGSGNISSVTDIGGAYPTQYLRISFTTPMPDKNYNIVTGLGGYLKQYGDREASSDTNTGYKQTSYFEIDIYGTSADSDIHCAIFR